MNILYSQSRHHSIPASDQSYIVNSKLYIPNTASPRRLCTENKPGKNVERKLHSMGYFGEKKELIDWSTFTRRMKKDPIFLRLRGYWGLPKRSRKRSYLLQFKSLGIIYLKTHSILYSWWAGLLWWINVSRNLFRFCTAFLVRWS